MREAPPAMTSREATPLLAYSNNASVERGAKDWAMLLSVGAIQWPWLLKSLYGGRSRDKAALLARLGLPDDALPNLGRWKADVHLLALIADLIVKMQPKMIVELGAGATTLVASQSLAMAGTGGRVVSYDQHADFVGATREWLAFHGVVSDIRHAPLASPSGEYGDLWYQLAQVPEEIDVLLIDGPPWATNPLIRGHAQRLFDHIAPGGHVILDDAARPGERFIAHRWQRDWPEFDWHYSAKGKGVLVGKRR